MVFPFLPDAEKLAAIREALPATGAGIYLNAGSLGPMPRETAKAMAELAEYELTVGRAAPDYMTEGPERMAEARAAVAAILSSDVGTVALTHSTTDAMNIAAWGLDWQVGDRAVTTNAEHWGGFGPLVALRDRLGVELDLIDVGDGGDADAIVAAFERAIGPRTRLVSLSHVLWTTGAIMPIRAIAEIARARGALVLVDGAQAVGVLPVVADELGADAYAVPAQKWLLGPEGMGALWVAPSALDRIRPTFEGYYSYETPTRMPPYRRFDDARRLESGAWHRPSVVGFGRSCGWLAMYVGLGWAHERAARLARRTADAVAAIPGVELLTPRHAMASLVTFRLPAWPGAAALDELGRRSFAIARTITGTEWLRFSVGFYNSEVELDRVVEVVELLGRHTPESLPPRPTLTMLGEA
ncbi:MAG: aminotransferase class V-fold PLP-dependent enzyme [Chloroflexi bacterium]|nr:aminotransferase class V-fold PLP-dependent enzyme [Chloroflexota bacterium]